jgi:hypothetical protein
MCGTYLNCELALIIHLKFNNDTFVEVVKAALHGMDGSAESETAKFMEHSSGFVDSDGRAIGLLNEEET